MTENFTENLSNNLRAYGFREMGDMPGGPVFVQNDGGILYVVRVAEYVDGPFINSAALPCTRDTEQFKNVFVISIYLLKNGAEPFMLQAENAEEYDGQRGYYVFWGVELTDGGYNFYHFKKQPDKILNLRELIERSASAPDAVKPESPLIPVAVPVITYAVMIVCGLYLAVIEMNGGSGDIRTLLRFGALYRPLVTEGGEYYRVFTAMFIHVGLTHFISNALGMYIVGTRVEKYLGGPKYLIIYVCSGLFGNLLCLALTNGVLAGASGAVFGTQGALLALILKTGKPVDGFTKLFVLLFATAGLCFSALFPNVANYAHFGGFFFGFGLGWAFAPGK